MNLQAYQQCITSLEKQISSRQQQRHQMAATIQQLNQHLQSQITSNSPMKQQIAILSQTNCELQQMLHQKMAIIEHLEQIINESMKKENFMKQKITMLETQKKNLQQEMMRRDELIEEMKAKANQQLQAQKGKSNSLIQGYRNAVNQKVKHCAQIQQKLAVILSQNSTLTAQLSQLKKQHQEQQHHIQQQAASTIQQLRLKIVSVIQQMQQLKQIHGNQLNTIEFTHGQQVDQLKKEERFLRGEVVHYLEVIDGLKKQLQQNRIQLQNAKQQCQKFNLGKDHIVNELINEINFLKQEKIQIHKKSSLEIQSITQEIINIGLEKVLYQQKQKLLQQQIAYHQSNNNQLTSQFKQLSIHYNNLSQENYLCSQKLLNQKNSTFQKHSLINQLTQQLDKVNRVVEGLKKERENMDTSSSLELTILRQHNIEFQRNLLSTQKKLQDQRINCVELEEQIKQLNYDKIKAYKKIDQLVKVVENHQSTLLNMQSLLEQSNKVITELNLTITAKLLQIQALENSNHIFRKQKLQWLQKQEEYRKKATELKIVKSAQRLNKVSTEYCVSSRSQSRLRTINECFGRSRAGSSVNGRGSQKLQHLYSMSLINNGIWQDSVSMPMSYLERMGLLNQQQAPCFAKLNNQNNINPSYQLSSSNEQSPQQQQDIQLNSQASKCKKTSRLKSSQSHQVDFLTLPYQIMKKKDKKLQYIIQNGKANHNYEMKKNYSSGEIHTRKQSD